MNHLVSVGVRRFGHPQDGVFAAGVAGQAAAGQAGEGGVGERCAGELTVGVVVGVAQQCAEPVDLRGAGYGEVVTGAEQDPQRFAVPVGARGGQPLGVQAQRRQDGQVGVDRVGLALSAAGFAMGLFALEHDQTGRGGGAGQPDAVAAGAFDRDDDAGSGGVFEDPGQQLGVAGGVVADGAVRRSGSPVGRAISTWWVSRWVSTPTTASTRSASMGTGVLLSGSGHVGTGPGSGHHVAYL